VANKYYLTEHEDDGDVSLHHKEFSTWEAMMKSKDFKRLARAVEKDELRGYGYLIVRPEPLMPMLGGFISDDMKDPSA
jgi:hypothetical protein